MSVYIVVGYKAEMHCLLHSAYSRTGRIDIVSIKLLIVDE